MVAQQAVSSQFDLVTDTHLEEVAEDEFSLHMEGIRLSEGEDRFTAIKFGLGLQIINW